MAIGCAHAWLSVVAGFDILQRHAPLLKADMSAAESTVKVQKFSTGWGMCSRFEGLLRLPSGQGCL